MRFRFAVVAILLARCSLASIAAAQVTTLTDTTSTPIPGAGHDYLGMLNETVSPENGSMSLRIGVPVPPGRKLTIPFSFAYDSNGVFFLQEDWQTGLGSEWGTNVGMLVSGGWSYSVPQLQRAALQFTMPPSPPGPPSPDGSTACGVTSGYIFTDASGTRHSLNLSHMYNNAPGYYGTLNWACGNSHFIESDSGGDPVFGAAFANLPPPGGFNPDTNPPQDGTPEVVNPDGTVYDFAQMFHCNLDPVNSYTSLPSIEDRNGNKVVFSAGTCTAFTATDTLNRTVLSGSNFGQSGSTVTVAGLAQPYTLSWASKSYSGYTAHAQSTFSSPPSGCSGTSFFLPAGSQSVVTNIEMPNTQNYEFSYDATYGTLGQITYPMGGYVSYTWGLNPLSAVFTFENLAGGAECADFIDTVAVTHRYVSFNGTAVAQQQDFSYSTNWNATPEPTKQTTVTTHDLIRGTSFQTVYNYTGMPGQAPPNMPGTTIFVETSILYYDTSGALLKTVTKGWLDQFRVACEFQTIGTSSLSSGVFYTYGSGAQITDKKEYDYGLVAASTCKDFATPPAVTASRDTATAYQVFANTPIFPSGPSIIDRPSSVITSGNVSGTLTRMAETDYSYDQTTPASASAVGHDETNYGPGLSPPRGNATTVTKQCFQGTTACSTNPVITSTYDETGQVTSMKDPNLNLTSYSYTDVYTSCSGNAPPGGATNSYLTQVTYPPTSGVAHIENYCYGYDDGQLRGATDENSQTTTYKYNSPANPPICSYSDELDRLTETDYPDGGKTYLCYHDQEFTPNVTTTKLLNSSQSVISTSTTDGVGHVTQTQLTSDPQGTDTVVTAYDGLGRTYTVTNPYRSGDTVYDTTYYYDALGRTTEVLKTDNSTVTTQYCNAASVNSTSATLVTDEAGHWRRSQSDGLGRLVEVDEPDSTTATVGACPASGDASKIWETNYTYNALNDLITVVQGGSHNRSFTYNSLKRLLTSVNPESGTIGYTYDLNGNLATKVDARSLTTTYTYDALNRVANRTYSNHDPTVTFTYDQSACLGQSPCYNIGHRTTMTDAGGSENLAYDPMGREKAETRAISTISKTTVYTYDLAGDLATLVYPTGSGRTITYTYDSAGRPSEAQDVADAVNYAQGNCNNGLSSTGVCYTAFGSVNLMQQNGTALTSTFLYNSRLQPCWLYTTTGTALATSTSCTATDSTPGNILDLQYNFNLGTGDNGNVIGITNNRTTGRTQSFTYDQVNRVLTAQTSSTTTNCWGELYTYDQWANMYAMTPLSGYGGSGCSQDNLSVSPTINNQLSTTGYAYDASGNMLADGAYSYTYNSESEITNAAGVVYKYDGDGNRILKSSGKAYWYGAGTEILDESDTSGNIANEYVFFGGKRIAMRAISTGTIYYYEEDMLGSSRTMVQAGQTTPCYDADFLPYGREIDVTDTCTQNYKFEGKERDTETLNDDFGARYYSWRLGRWLSADWSATPEPVPYANLSNPQTLNLYAMVSDNPETFADLDGHDCCTIWDAINFVAGALNAYSSDNLGGAGRQTQDTTIGGMGQAAGDTIATFEGAEKVGTGGTVAAASLPLDETGAGALVGIPVAAAAGALAAQGMVEGSQGFGNLIKDVTAPMQSSGKPYESTPENQERMQQGKAPTGNDGKPVELHHEGQTQNGPVKEMTQTEHRGGGNFKKNHANTGQNPSQINRSQAQQQRKKYWKDKTNQQN